MEKKLPDFLKKYLWDIDFETFDFSKRRTMVLKRIMEHGDSEAVRWMKRNFSEREMKGVLASSRDISERSANYWALILGSDREEVRCLRKQFPKEQGKPWPR